MFTSVLLLTAVTAGCSTETSQEPEDEDTSVEEVVSIPDYVVYNTQTYVRDSKQVLGFRVLTSEDVSEDDMRLIHSNLLELHDQHHSTTWFYNTEEEAEIGLYTLGMLEGYSEDVPDFSEPIF